MAKTKSVKKTIKKLPDLRPGYRVKVYWKIKESGKERIQPFEGVVIAKRHGKETGATFTVRKVIEGIGVERIFPLHSPLIEKVTVLKRSKVRRAKLFYLRKKSEKESRMKKGAK